MEKLIFKRKKAIPRYEGKTSKIVRVRNSTMEYVEEIAEETGLSQIDVIAKMIKYAYENSEYMED